MGLDKAIKSGKEHRKKYYGAKRYDPSCRNHGGCPFCESGRLRYKKKIKDKIKDNLKEIVEGCDK